MNLKNTGIYFISEMKIVSSKTDIGQRGNSGNSAQNPKKKVTNPKAYLWKLVV